MLWVNMQEEGNLGKRGETPRDTGGGRGGQLHRRRTRAQGRSKQKNDQSVSRCLKQKEGVVVVLMWGVVFVVWWCCSSHAW